MVTMCIAIYLIIGAGLATWTVTVIRPPSAFEVALDFAVLIPLWPLAFLPEKVFNKWF